jgi:hypothetical protein
MQKQVIGLLALMMLIIAGCAGAVQKSCSSMNRSGDCTLTIPNVEDDTRQYLELDSFFPFRNDTRIVQVSVTVGEGAAEVRFETDNGQTVSTQASAGRPGTTQGVIGVDSRYRLYFDVIALDGPAADVEIKVVFN